jgi:holo-[acyl-carrier protein] synthase
MKVLSGIDLVETSRIAASLERLGEAFLRRVFTAEEVACCESRGASRVQSYAARWAAKEACSKAFGTGIGAQAAMHEIEVWNEESGQPRLRLHGTAAATAERLGVQEMNLSLTHTEHYAAAFVVLVTAG